MTLEDFLSEWNNDSDRAYQWIYGKAQADVGREEADAQLCPHYL